MLGKIPNDSPTAMTKMSVPPSPQNSYVENLMPKEMVLEAPLKVIKSWEWSLVLQKSTENSFAPSTTWGHQETSATQPWWHPHLQLLASRCEKYILLYNNYPVCSIL